MAGGDGGGQGFASPQILCGDRYEDGWVSPYVRGRFPAQSQNTRLVLSLYCPDTESSAVGVAVRRGAAEILIEDIVPPGELVTWWRELPSQVEAERSIDISIRTDRSCVAADGDVRRLGILVTEWRLEDAVTQAEDVHAAAADCLHPSTAEHLD